MHREDFANTGIAGGYQSTHGSTAHCEKEYPVRAKLRIAIKGLHAINKILSRAVTPALFFAKTGFDIRKNLSIRIAVFWTD